MNSWFIKRSMLMLMLMLMLMNSTNGYGQAYPVQYIEEALENNPQVAAARKAWEAAQQEAGMVSSLPDPQLNAGIFTPPMERLMGTQWFSIELMQMFPWFGTLKSQRTVAEQMADEAFHRYREEKNNLVMQMTSLWLEITRQRLQADIIESSLQVLNAREDLIYSRYSSGQQASSSALDIYRLEVQIAKWENELEKLQVEIRSSVQQFNLLIGRNTDEPVETPSELPEVNATKFAIHSDAFAANPMLNMTLSEVGAAEAQQRVSRLMTRPMLGLGVQYSYFSEGDAMMGQMDGGHMIMPMLSVTLPIYGRKNRASIRRGELLYEEAQLKESNSYLLLENEHTKLVSALRNLQSDMDFYTRQKEIIGRMEELIITAYSSGNETFQDLLETEDQLLELQEMILENRIMQMMTASELQMIMAQGVFE